MQKKVEATKLDKKNFRLEKAKFQEEREERERARIENGLPSRGALAFFVKVMFPSICPEISLSEYLIASVDQLARNRFFLKNFCCGMPSHNPKEDFAQLPIPIRKVEVKSITTTTCSHGHLKEIKDTKKMDPIQAHIKQFGVQGTEPPPTNPKCVTTPAFPASQTPTQFGPIERIPKIWSVNVPSQYVFWVPFFF